VSILAAGEIGTTYDREIQMEVFLLLISDESVDCDGIEFIEGCLIHTALPFHRDSWAAAAPPINSLVTSPLPSLA
jgi:hypothetical protein